MEADSAGPHGDRSRHVTQKPVESGTWSSTTWRAIVQTRGSASRLEENCATSVEVATSYYPASFAAGTALAGPARIRGGAIAVLASLGRAPAEVAESVTARRPDNDECAILRIADTEPLMVLTRLSVDADGRPVEFAVNRMVARLTGPISYRLRVPA